MFLATALLPGALAGPLRLDPMQPPVHIGHHEGRPVYRFAPGVELPVRPGVVIQLHADAAPPAGAVWLGGPSWLVPAEAPIERALALAAAPGVARAFPDVLLPQAPAGFDDPTYGGQWYLESLGMDALYAVSMGDADTRVAVIDSGIDIVHPDLASAVVEPYDAWSDDDDPSPDPGEYCSGASRDICDEHGTAVSGIVLARANNGVGIVGMCPECTLVPIKLLGETGGTPLSADVAAFEHAIAADVAVINNSWGFTTSIPVPDTLADVIRRAATEPRGGLGALVVFAAGNDDREIADDEMQAMEEVLCVSAIDSYGYPTNYTNSGAAVDVAAPSATVSIAPEEGTTTTFGGTSAAAPVASGLAAWAVAQDPDLSAGDLMALLIDTAVPSPYVPADDSGRNDLYGWGVISAEAVLETLHPPAAPPEDEGEDPAACGCRAADPAGAWLSALALLLLRRRR
jgi:MYXO-CTERM domain-containing protein